MEQDRNPGIRINKYLSDAGVCSRREADRQIEAGRVTIDGNVAALGDRVISGQHVCLDGKSLSVNKTPIILAFHKPVGIVCTEEKREKNNIIHYLNYPVRVFTVGRLDKESEGLILLTNDGELSNRINKARNLHDKEYVVTVDRDITPKFLKDMGGGLYLEELDVTTRPCLVKKIDKHTFSIVLTQGYNRQIRRMCQVCGYQVKRLIRVRIMNIHLGDLKSGSYRELTEEEKSLLYTRCGL